MAEIQAEPGEVSEALVRIAEALGIGDVLRRINNEGGEKTKPNFWTENKTWLIPSMIGGGALLGIMAIVQGTRKK